MSAGVALVMAGGTGGHIFPGLAVAHGLRERGWRVHWLGAPAPSMESRLVPPQGFAFEAVQFSGVRGKGLVSWIRLPMKLLQAFWQSLQVVRRVRPDVVVGLGGADGQQLAQALAPALGGQALGLCCLGHLPAVLDDARGLDALGLQMLASQIDVAAQTVLGAITGQRPPTAFMHANLNTLYHLHLDAASEGLGTALRSARAGVFFEGVALKLGHLLLSGRWRSDVSGTDLVPEVLARLAAPLRIALVGGRPGVAAQAARTLAARFGAVQVVGTWDGFADCADAEHLLQAVAAAQPDMVLVGMGTPIQEPLCQRLLACPTVRVAWAVGGLLDYLSGHARLAPSCIRRIRLEWLWRLVCNPAKYWRRYLLQGLWFFWFLLARLPRAVRLARAQA